MQDTVVANAAAICVIRDAVDMVSLLCGHYLRLGFGRVSFVDDGSTDGTYEALARMAQRTRRVSVTRVVEDRFLQATLVTAAANSLIEEGFRFIVPFDSDEFWHLSAGDVRRLATRDAPGQVACSTSNFVQSRRVSTPRRFSLFSVRYRVGANAKASRAGVLNFEQAWVAKTYRKVCFWTQKPVVIGRGYHRVKGVPADSPERGFEIFHLPLRSKYELVKRAVNYEPRRDPARKQSESWQSRFHREVVESGRTDAVWAANSADRTGCLDVYGRRVQLVRDNRLRHVLLLAALYVHRPRFCPAR